MIIKKIMTSIKANTNIFKNIVGAYAVKGASILLSFFSLPAYMRYFENSDVLGLWYTILSLITWIFMFDFGIGHGLRNKLVDALVKKDEKLAKHYVSSAYYCIGGIVLLFCILSVIAIMVVDWNSFFNISIDIIDNQDLKKTMIVVIVGILLQFELKLINSILYALQKSSLNNFLNFMSSLLIFVYLILGKNYGDINNLFILAIVNAFAVNIPLIVVSVFVFMNDLTNMKPSFLYVNKKQSKEVLDIGIVLLWMQFVWLVIASMHPILISKIISPRAVVEYQIYYKIFNAVASVAIIALIPIWSAVTKAAVEKRYDWIRKLYKILLALPIFIFVFCLLILPFLETAVDIWLGDNSININLNMAICLLVFNSLFVLHNVNTSISNGMSWFNVQTTWMTVAALLMIPVSIILCEFFGDWRGVVYASAISILPYEIIQPIRFKKYIRSLSNE